MSDSLAVRNRTLCFSSKIYSLTSRELAKLAKSRRSNSLVLEDYQISAFELFEMPAQTDTGNEKISQPFTELSSERVQDPRGEHVYWLTELNEWAVSLVAKLTDDQVDHFCRRWSASDIYRPFQGWEGVAPEVALQMVREDAYKKLLKFLTCFRPFCRDAQAARRGVFLLREWHNNVNL